MHILIPLSGGCIFSGTENVKKIIKQKTEKASIFNFSPNFHEPSLQSVGRSRVMVKGSEMLLFQGEAKTHGYMFMTQRAFSSSLYLSVIPPPNPNFSSSK